MENIKKPKLLDVISVIGDDTIEIEIQHSSKILFNGTLRKFLNMLIDNSGDLIEYYGDFIVNSIYADGSTSMQFYVSSVADEAKDIFKEFLNLIDMQNDVEDIQEHDNNR